jgi:uncharacterized OB-fold protein
MRLRVVERIFPVDPGGLLPAVTADNKHYWDGLAQGELNVQGCSACRRLRYPIVPVCPYCGSTRWSWSTLCGTGRVFSWVRYHRSYLPEFEDLMPYVVITAELDEGVRMFGRLVDKLDLQERVQIGTPVEVIVERWPDGRCVPAFRFAALEKTGER